VTEPRTTGGGWTRTLLLVALAAASLGPSIVGRELLPPDEPRFALVAREMFVSGDWIVPTRGGQLYLDKPPLLFWTAALAFRAAGGPSEAAARFPSLLATLLLVLVLHRQGRRWFGEPTATLGSLVFSSFLLVQQRGAWVATDALLASAVFLALAALDRARDGETVPAILAGLAAALGVLAKGPVALLHLVLAALAGLLAGERVSLRPLLRPAGLLSFLAVALPWPVLLVARLGWDVPRHALWHQNVERFARSWDNLEPWWYHGKALFLGTLPWSLLLLGALAPAVLGPLLRQRRARWLAGWALLELAFFSLPQGKRGVYLLPVYPALALLAARAIPLVTTRRGPRLTGSVAAGTAALAALAGAISLLAGGPGLPAALATEPAVRRGAIALLFLVAVTVGAAALLLARADRRYPWSLAGLLLGAGILWPTVLAPAIDAGQGARSFAAAARQAVPPEAEIAVTRTKWEIVAWYTGWSMERLATPDEVRAWLASGGCRVVLGPPGELGARERWPRGSRVLLEGRLGRRRYLVVGRGCGGPSSPRLEQSMGEEQLPVGEQLLGAPPGDDSTPVEDRRLRAEHPGEVEVVRRDQLGRRQVPEQLRQLPPAPWVEAGGRLVEQEHARLEDQDTGEAGPPLLSLGEVMGRPVPVAGEADPRESLLRPPGRLVPRDPAHAQAPGHVFRDRQGEELVVRVLEDDPHRPAQHPGGRPVRPGTVPDRHLARGPVLVVRVSRPVGVGVAMPGQQARHVQEERGLARPVGPEEGDPRPGSHVQVDPPEGWRPIRPVEGEAADADPEGRPGHGVPPRARRASSRRSARASARRSRAATSRP